MSEARRPWARVVAALLLAAACAVAAQEPAALRATADEPRAYGWQVGDLVSRRIHIDVPPGLVLDDASLPATGRVGHSFELREVRWQGGRSGGPHTLDLRYQIFRSPPAVRTFEFPTITLRFTGQPRAQELRIEAWPVTISPLVPEDVSPRRGLGDLQPEAPPPLLDTTAVQHRLLAYALLALPLLAWLAHVYLALPWLARRGRPFAAAWRALQTRPALQPAQAYRRFHEALNASAGAVLFEQGLDDYLAAQPRYAPLRAELQRFFAESRAAFFGAEDAHATLQAAMPALRDLCRRCRDAERGAA